MGTLNCGAISPNLVESHLFGHERGAFTGADQQRAGIFEAARGGTVFLDEVGELSQNAQAALLRVLDTKRVVRLGASTEIPTDFRLLAATNRNLEKMVQAGTFRLDLFHRINTLCLRLPPLRARTIEIPPLISLFIRQANHRFNRNVAGVDKAASKLLMQYQWPGNVRELRNVIDRAVLITKRTDLCPTDLPQMLQNGSPNLDATEKPEQPAQR